MCERLSGSTSTLEPEIFVLVLRVVMFDAFDVQEELVCLDSTFHCADECVILRMTFAPQALGGMLAAISVLAI